MYNILKYSPKRCLSADKIPYTWFMDRWRPVDPNADYFNPNTQWISGYYPVTGHDGRRTGTNGVQNASYIRLKTAQIGYTLPYAMVI